MTDDRPLPTGLAPDDPFERELRALLRDRAAGPVPASLAGALDDATRRSAPIRVRMAGHRRPVLTLAAAAAGLLLIGMGLNPVSMFMEATVPGATKPTPHLAHEASPSAGPSVAPAPAILWDNGETRLTADALAITVGDQVYTGLVPGVDVDGSGGSLTSRTLEIEWPEHDRPMRLNVYLAADAGTWGITEIRTYDGSPGGAWLTYQAPGWRLPIGATWSGDLHLAAAGATLDIMGMTLRAFSPDTLPAAMRLCRSAMPEGASQVDPTAEGQPLAGTGIAAMSPAEAKLVLQRLGLCHTFRYEYPYTEGGTGGYAELWCDPPPGRIMELTYGGDGEVIVFVEDASPQPHSPRPQPPVGWGCR